MPEWRHAAVPDSRWRARVHLAGGITGRGRDCWTKDPFSRGLADVLPRSTRRVRGTMSFRAQRNVLLVLIGIVVLAGITRVATAQDRGSRLSIETPLLQLTVFAGSELGFRLERFDNQIPVGQFVVKVDGVWQPVSISK